MTPAHIDADAMNCLRSFGFLEDLEHFVAANPGISEPLLCVAGVARRELNPIQRDILRLETAGVLKVVEVLARSPASQQLRRLREKHRGIDRGEAEAIAWLLAANRVIPFVSCDRRARGIANEEGLPAWDILDLVHEWKVAGVLSLGTACHKLAAWSDDRSAPWRPRDFQGVEGTLRQRYGPKYLVGFEDR